MPPSIFRVTALSTLAALLLFTVTPAYTAPSATLSGAVVARDTHEPLGGSRVHVASVRTGELVASQSVKADGSFSIADLPAEPVSVGVEARGRLYVSPTPVPLTTGAEQVVTVSIPDPTTLAPAKNDDDDDRAGWWMNPVTGSLTVVILPIFVGVILEQTDDDPEQEGPPSPSEPEE